MTELKSLNEVFFNKKVISNFFLKIFALTSFTIITSCLLVLERNNRIGLEQIAAYSFFILYVIYLYIDMKIKLNYSKPAIIIYYDQVEFHDFNYYFRLKKKIVYYKDIKYMGIINKRFKIKLLNEETVKYDLSQCDIDSDKLCRLINEVNPQIKLPNIGVFDYKLE